jgi:hypothetical protein
MHYLCLAMTACSPVLAYSASAHENEVEMFVRGDDRCIISNGTPNYDIGQFPNRVNPHTFAAQQVEVCVDATPDRTGLFGYAADRFEIHYGGPAATSSWQLKSGTRPTAAI